MLVQTPDVEEVVARVSAWIGPAFSLMPGSDPPIFQGFLLDTDIRIFRATFQDDQELPLSAYGCAVDLEFVPDALRHDEQLLRLKSLAILIAGHLHRQTGWPCLALEGLEIKLADHPGPRADSSTPILSWPG